MVYYLVHSMTDEDDLLARERLAAENVQAMLNKSAVREVIYLSAMQHKDSDSPHLAARRLTGEILADSRVPVTEIRAAIIVGPGSAAFEIMRDMVYNLPILTPPRWARSKSSPVALENLLNYLTGLLSHPQPKTAVLMPQGRITSVIWRCSATLLPSAVKAADDPAADPLRLISVHFLRLITTVPEGIAKELIMGLKYDLPGDGKPLQALIPQTLLSFDDAVRKTLKDEADAVDNEDWGMTGSPRPLAAGLRFLSQTGWFYPEYLCLRRRPVARCAADWRQRRLFYANILWSVRARWMTCAVIKSLTAARIAIPSNPDKIDGWKVITVKPRSSSPAVRHESPGLGRLTFTIRDHGHQRTLDVRAGGIPPDSAGCSTGSP